MHARRFYAIVLECGGAGILVTLCLGLDYAAGIKLPAYLLSQCRNVAVSFCEKRDLQWIILTCAFVCLVGFGFIERSKTGRVGLGQILATVLCLTSTMLYFGDFEVASTTVDAVVLSWGMVLFRGVISWQRCDSARTKRLGIMAVVVGMVLLFLGVSSILRPTISQAFFYRGQHRLSGIWDNPNTYGALMGVGVVLSVGWIGSCVLCCLSHASSAVAQCQKAAFRWRLQILLLLAAAMACGVGLLNSFSRGAWVGAACALGYFGYQFMLRLAIILSAHQQGRAGESSSMFSRITTWCDSFVRALRPNSLPLVVILMSIFPLAFWNCQDAKHASVRRIVSVADSKDFSWRNRVSAWEAALQMSADRLLFGHGWNGPARVQDNLYRVPKLDEVLPVQLNDCLLLVTTLGVPALTCLVALVMFSAPWGVIPGIVSISLGAPCRAATLALLVSFWFDGGLLRLATGSMFWILLALGSEEDVGLPRLATPCHAAGGAGADCVLRGVHET